MKEYIVIQAPVDESLQEFSRYLWEQQVAHRIVAEGDKQLLLVGSESDAAQVSQAYRQFREGSGELPAIERTEDQALVSLYKQLYSAPVTLVLIVLSALGFLLVFFDPAFYYVKYLTFFDLERHSRFISFTLPQGEYWRFLTPIFLHFSWLHIVFNALWLWELGRRIERVQGSVSMVGIVMTMGLGSNIAQAKYAEVGVFGGMSGVIYGLLGYGWMWSTLCPKHSIGIPKPVLIFMLASLVFFYIGGASLLGVGSVANAAHLGGLIMGMILGIGAGLIARASGRE